MNEISVIFTGVVSIIGAITTLLVRSRLLEKNRKDALVLPEDKRYDYLLSIGEKIPTTGKIPRKDYVALLNRKHDHEVRKTYVWVALLLFSMAFILVILYINPFKASANPQQESGIVPKPRPFPEVVREKCDKIHKVFSDKELRKKLICNQYVEDDNLILEFKGVKDFYELGEYDFSRNQHVKVLADLIGEIYKDFDVFRSSEPSFFVDLLISASADGNQMTEKKPYAGSQELACECYKKGTSQSQIEQLVPNKEQVDGYLLGCARAGYFADYLLTQKQVKIDHLKLTGREFEEKGGEYRNIKVTITFNNILKLGKVDKCKICQ